ncbi:hypothetical protein [Nonomuraea endophytica]|uniref:hypothetical protein n=1 Tax=Nonomuraea endophytica TaxID=714136 RepID=UPI0037C706F5
MPAPAAVLGLAGGAGSGPERIVGRLGALIGDDRDPLGADVLGEQTDAVMQCLLRAPGVQD